MTRFLVLTSALLSVTLAGCSELSQTEQRTLSAGTIGAAGGAVLGAIGGNAGLGAAAGAGAGLAGGYLYDNYKQSQQSSYEKGVRDGAAKSSAGPASPQR
jgi:hypothetical protein